MTFKEFYYRTDEGLLDALWAKRQEPQEISYVPSALAYHIADAINAAMIQAGKMDPLQKHTPPGADSPNYDPAMKSRLKDYFYGVVKQMMASGNEQGIMKYFGFDLRSGRPVGQGQFVADIAKQVQQAA